MDHTFSILVVDDLPDAATSTAALLAIHGLLVRAATSGEAALDLAAAEFPAGVFLDLRMPGMDGFELARRLRAMAAGRKLTLVAVSGSTTEADRRKTAAAGIDLFLLKPANPEVLVELVGKVCRGEPDAPDGQALENEKRPGQGGRTASDLTWACHEGDS